MQRDGRGQRRRQQQLALARREPGSGRHRCVHQRDLEREAVHAGDGGDARQRNVIDLRGAQQVPGKSGDVGARQLDRDPEERREYQRAQAESVAARGDQREQQPKEPVIEPKIQRKHHQQQDRHRRADPAVEVHDVEHPGAASQVPDDSADISQQKSLPRRRGGQELPAVGEHHHDILLAALQDGVDQRSQRDPAQQVESRIGKIRT